MGKGNRKSRAGISHYGTSPTPSGKLSTKKKIPGRPLLDYVITINDELTSKRLEFGLETLEDREKREEWEN